MPKENSKTFLLSLLTTAPRCDMLYRLRLSRCGGIGRRHGLKIRWEQSRTGSSPVIGTNIAEWSSLVARRAHNPKVMWFKSLLRNQKRKPPVRGGFLFAFGVVFNFHDLRYERDPDAVGWRANNLEPKGKRLSIVFPTALAVKQGAEGAIYDREARRPCDRRGGHVVQIPSPQPTMRTEKDIISHKRPLGRT